ncbi:hypothetical protein [Pseudonocardia pini]|uniref:hypothetical protein n=1 Tax=Pseudonocardia pini TaxID=2758030 RepID=UPI0015F0AF85|nr:hypothetical protein [Pseudonocardia pini]
MRSAFAHTAELDLASDLDQSAPGAAIAAELGEAADDSATALHTAVGRVGGRVRLRVLFACDVDLEDEVRLRICRALARGRTTGPDGSVTSWSLRDALPGAVQECERADAERLLEV